MKGAARTARNGKAFKSQTRAVTQGGNIVAVARSQ